jgi:hypothetical protein
LSATLQILINIVLSCYHKRLPQDAIEVVASVGATLKIDAGLRLEIETDKLVTPLAALRHNTLQLL